MDTSHLVNNFYKITNYFHDGLSPQIIKFSQVAVMSVSTPQLKSQQLFDGLTLNFDLKVTGEQVKHLQAATSTEMKLQFLKGPLEGVSKSKSIPLESHSKMSKTQFRSP